MTPVGKGVFPNYGDKQNEMEGSESKGIRGC